MELTPERIELLLTITQEPSRRFLSRAYSSGCVKIERRAISSSGPDGEIGRHSGLKIRRKQFRGGSSPPPGTILQLRYVVQSINRNEHLDASFLRVFGVIV